MSACQKVAHVCSYLNNNLELMDYRSIDNRYAVSRMNSRYPGSSYTLRRSPSLSGSGIVADNYGVTLTSISSAPSSTSRYSSRDNHSILRTSDNQSYRTRRSGKPPLPAIPTKRPPSPFTSSSGARSLIVTAKTSPSAAVGRRLAYTDRRASGDLYDAAFYGGGGGKSGESAVASLARRFEHAASLNAYGGDAVTFDSAVATSSSTLGLKSALASPSRLRDRSSDRSYIFASTTDRTLTPKLYRDKKVAFSLPNVPDHVRNMGFREFDYNSNSVLLESIESTSKIDSSSSSSSSPSSISKYAPGQPVMLPSPRSAKMETRSLYNPSSTNAPESARKEWPYEVKKVNDDDSVPSKARDNKLGLIGLRNLGNTCFMNSVLQCLSSSSSLREYCVGGKFLMDINTPSRMKGALIKAFSELLSELWASKTILSSSYINPEKFKLQIQKFAPRFTGYNQQDAQEFLRYLLQGLHEDVNRIKTDRTNPALASNNTSASNLYHNNNNNLDSNGYQTESQKANEAWKRYLTIDNSRIVDIFVGQLKSELKCTHCGHMSTTYDPFWDLSLPIPQPSMNGYTSSRYGSSVGHTVALTDCMDAFTKEEVLDGDEKPTCENCNVRRKCLKKFSLHKLPQILVLHLKRFTGERYKSRLSTLVQFPLTKFDLSPYICQRAGSNFSTKYDLYAISNHTGTPLMGHYTAYCRRSPDKTWYLFDDTRVSPVHEQNVVSGEAYVLFYEMCRQSSDEKPIFNHSNNENSLTNGSDDEPVARSAFNNYPATISSRF